MEKLTRFRRQLQRSELHLVKRELDTIPQEVRDAMLATLYDPSLSDKRAGVMKVTTIGTEKDWKRRSGTILQAARQIAEMELDGDPEKVSAADRDRILREALRLMRERTEELLYPAKKINAQRQETRKKINDLTQAEKDPTATVSTRYNDAAVITGLETALADAETEYDAHPSPQNLNKLKKAKDELDFAKKMQNYARSREGAEAGVTRAKNELARIRLFNTEVTANPAACLSRLTTDLATATTEYDTKRVDFEADRNNRAKKTAFEEAKTELNFIKKLHQMAVEHMQGLNEDTQKEHAQEFVQNQFLTNPAAAQTQLKSYYIANAVAQLQRARADYASNRTEANRLALAAATSTHNLWQSVKTKVEEYIKTQAARDEYSRLASSAIPAVGSTVPRGLPALIKEIYADPTSAEGVISTSVSMANSVGQKHRERILQQLLALCRQYKNVSGVIAGHLPGNKKKRFEVTQKIDDLLLKVQQEKDQADEAFKKVEKELKSPDYLVGTPSDKVLTPGRLTDLEQEYQEKTVEAVNTAQEKDKLTDMITEFNNRLSELTQKAGEKLSDNSNGRDLAFRGKYLRSHKGKPAPPTSQPEALADAQRKEEMSWAQKQFEELKGLVGWDTLLEMINKGAGNIGEQVKNLFRRKKHTGAGKKIHVRAGARRAGQVTRPAGTVIPLKSKNKKAA